MAPRRRAPRPARSRSARRAAVPVTARPGHGDGPCWTSGLASTRSPSPPTARRRPCRWIVGDSRPTGAAAALTGLDGRMRTDCCGLVAVSTWPDAVGGNLAADCPSQADARQRRTAGHLTFWRSGITGLNLVRRSPRGVAAADVSGPAAMAKRRYARSGHPRHTSGGFRMGAAVPVEGAVARSEDEPAGGIGQAPWLLASGVVRSPVGRCCADVQPGGVPGRLTGHRAPCSWEGLGAGYLAWLRAGGAAPARARRRSTGRHRSTCPWAGDMHMAQPRDWYRAARSCRSARPSAGRGDAVNTQRGV